MATTPERLLALAAPVATALGCELWGVELIRSRNHSLLRVFIDKIGGVSVDDCERVSRHLASVLDVEDPIPGEYTLEVSSPGMDRPFFTPHQYHAYIGEDIRVQLRAPFEGRRKYRGRLTAVAEGDIVMEVDDHEYRFPFASIDKANLVPRF